jgi:putative ABC transport system permease protein
MAPSETLFRALLRSFPASYRAEHGEELAQFFRDRWTDEVEERGRFRATVRWPMIAWDLVKEGIGERVSSKHRPGGEQSGRGGLRLTHDLRLAVRALRRSPGFTAVAIATLAIAIAANSAMFRLVDAVLLRPLPYTAADRLITIDHPVPKFGENQAWGLSVRGYFHMSDETQTFTNMGAYGPMTVSLSGDGPPERIIIARITHSMMPVFGARPALGRLIDADDDTPGGTDAVVLGHGLWVRRYGADPQVLGKTIQLDGRSRTVIGVMEAGIHMPDLKTDAWIPWGHDPASRPVNSHYLTTVARLDDGVSLEQARADVERVFGTYGETFPRVYNDQFIEVSGFGVRVRTLQERVVGTTANTLWVLLGSVGLVLFMAAANVANLFLIRTEGRRRDVALRTALGADRMTLLKYFLVESAVVAGVAGTLGLLLGGAGLRAITGAFPESLPRLDELSAMVDGRTALFTLAITSGLTLTLGLLPMVRFGRDTVARALATLGRGNTDDRSATLGGRILVGAQVAIALVLLAGALASWNSFRALHRVDMGFDPEGVVTFEVNLPSAEYQDHVSVAGFMTQLFERIEALPGVVSVGAVDALPLAHGAGCYAIFIEGVTVEGDAPDCPKTKKMTPGYFATMGIPMLAGRELLGSDLDRPSGEIIVNQALADVYWPGEDAVGKRLKPNGLEPPFYAVAGVVANVHIEGLDREAPPIWYFPPLAIGEGWNWQPMRSSEIVIKTTGPIAPLAQALPGIVQELEPGVPVAEVLAMETIVAQSMARNTFSMTLLLVAATVALLLGTVGLYGVISYMVRRRRTEIGVRLALGAQPRDVHAQVLRQALTVVAIGATVGLVVALGLSTVVTGLFYEANPVSVMNLAVVSGLLIGIGLLAAHLPARRAARVDPAECLRSE